MSKIGRKPITLSTATVDIKGRVINIKGPKGSFTHELPESLSANLEDKTLTITVANKNARKASMEWGLHRALLANKVQGVETGFEIKLKIVGLGYKAQVSGKKMVFSLGYSHKIDFELPESVEIEVDRSGQNLSAKSIDKFILGKTCDAIKSLRPPEPYKGTGIMVEGESIRRKAGKAKAA